MTKHNHKFWQQKSLSQLSEQEWESLCDGCGRCCLNKLEDEDSGEVFYTDVACKLLDLNSCRCSDYHNRVKCVPDCLVLGMDHPEYFNYLPNSCAYRRLHEGKSLPDWHPLVSGTADSMRQADISIAGKCISEQHLHPDELEDRIIEFNN